MVELNVCKICKPVGDLSCDTVEKILQYKLSLTLVDCKYAVLL